ncbi:MAG: DEAD/DEAH box helicase, partial [Phycisphaerales bacterium]|nr:DEAD/DEAH box helicase [Phycisphaerales bacterium]
MPGLFGEDPATDQPPPMLREGEVLVRVAVERGIDRLGSASANARRSALAGGAAAPDPTDTGPPDDGALTYRAMMPIAVGDRVEVPLGRANRPEPGIVVEVGGAGEAELAEGLGTAKLKSIFPPKRKGALGSGGAGDGGVSGVAAAALPPDLVELARWMASYYVCPLGMVLATMLPAAVKHDTGAKLRTVLAPLDEPALTAHLATAKLTPSAKRAWESIAALDPSTFPIGARDLATTIDSRTLAPINSLVRIGLLVASQRREIVAPEWDDLSVEGSPSSSSSSPLPIPHSPLPSLAPHQSRAVSGISTSLDSFSVHLLRGVTGSGKTEVYLRLIADVLRRGKTALVLVPEISLTPQTAGRFQRRFGAGSACTATVAVLHSGLTASQRHQQWALAARSAESGGAGVVIGARSAVFAPLRNLGLVVVDEEHAGDYKQDQLPRYHGRDVAIKRAQAAGCPIILGSATPSIESWANATGPSAKYKLWELTSRVGGGALPHVEVLDLVAERRAAAELAAQ